MPGLRPDVDPDGLLEYSVVYTDRAVNHMSAQFQHTMRDLHAGLTSVYGAESAVIVPGSGTFGMEAVARQFAHDKHCLILRNGWFSYRWTQILDTGRIPKSQTVMKAAPLTDNYPSPFAPAAIESVVAAIRAEKPDLVFAPHVETSAGMMLPDDYLRAVADAVREVGGLFVLDCIASGTAWVNMQDTGVDILVTAPQKGWSGSPCAGVVLLGPRAIAAMADTVSSSFAADLAKWHQIMQAYVNGGHAYHATMPTDGLITFRQVMQELDEFGFELAKQRQFELGEKVLGVLNGAGFQSIAAEGFQAPGVIVCFTGDDTLQTGKAFAAEGLQIAAGVPLQVDEPASFKTFRVGLFGIDKLKDVDAAVARFEMALSRVRAV